MSLKERGNTQKMKSEYVVLIGVIFSLIGTATYDELKSGTYIQCREGRTYGTWEKTTIDYQFKCDLTGQEELCWKTTKTRCHTFDEEKLKEMLKNKEISNQYKNTVCSRKECN